MRTIVTTFSLLDSWASQLGLLYLSDLKYGGLSAHQLCESLNQFPPEDYPCKEWNDAIEYLTDQRPLFISSREAKAYLLEYLQKLP